MQTPARQTRLSILLWVAFVALSLLMLLPVLAAPLEADDRYWYLNVSREESGSYWDLVEQSFAEVPATIRQGRVAPLAFAARRVVGRLTTEIAVAGTIPIVAVHGVAKLGLLAASALCVFGFVKAIRWRTATGAPAPLSSATITAVMALFAAFLVVGAKTNSPFQNGWVSYPVLTYGAVMAVFGTLAATLWAAGRVARRQRQTTALVFVAALGAGLNLTYELYYVVVPLVPLLLMTSPISDDVSDQRRARRAVSGIYLGSFALLFIVIRVLIGNACSGGDCYLGVEPSLGATAFATAWRNVASTLPGIGYDQAAANIIELGYSPGWSMPLGTMVKFVGPLLATTLAFILIRVLPTDDRSLGEKRGEAAALIRVGAVSLLVAGGAALIGALSSRAQEMITATHMPYRNAVVTWTALALLAAVLLVTIHLRGIRVAPTVLAAGTIAWFGWLALPLGAEAVRLYRVDPRVQVIERIHWEIVLGDPSPEGDIRRCALYARAEDSIFTAWIETTMKRGARDTFQHYHGQPFCSTWSKEI